MKSERFAQLPNCDERLVVAVPSDVKARLFRVATERGLPASALIREALAVVMDGPRAA